MKKTILLSCIAWVSLSAFSEEYHVSPKGNDTNNGSVNQPVKTINAAAAMAQPGDIVTVHEGTYREWVNPPRGGESDSKRIIYRAAKGETVHIKGSEQITNWEKVKNGVWKVTLPNTFFGDTNPYNTLIEGDWFDAQKRIHHTGEVFLNGKSLYEMDSLAQLLQPVTLVTKADPEGTTGFWYCETNDKQTTIWANFSDVNPNKELVEINARKTCFYPEKPGVNYITIDGFHISQAAAQWAAPTAEQIGMIATHWNKGWIIENNIISNAKCSGITLGKERSTGHNVWLDDMAKDGSLHYIEVTFRALRHGWNKENIGSHIVRNNKIFNCEQTGMCGSMGAAFSKVYGNHIYNIWTKRQFTGAEIGGIKFHAAIDTEISKNRIHDVGRGIWLDWMTQGTHVSKNLLYNNDLEDLFLEVNHGPYLVDNNIFLSPMSIQEQSEGGAFVHNLIAGGVHAWNEPNRYTPYHLAHSTEVAGLSTIVNGDNRYYNNIFIGKKTDQKPYGLAIYNTAKQEIHTGGNHFYNGAAPYIKECNGIIDNALNPEIVLTEKEGNLYLSFTGHPLLQTSDNTLITTEVLGKAVMTNALFDQPTGTPLVINTDYFGTNRSVEHPTSGPFEKVAKKQNEFQVW